MFARNVSSWHVFGSPKGWYAELQVWVNAFKEADPMNLVTLEVQAGRYVRCFVAPGVCRRLLGEGGENLLDCGKFNLMRNRSKCHCAAFVLLTWAIASLAILAGYKWVIRSHPKGGRGAMDMGLREICRNTAASFEFTTIGDQDMVFLKQFINIRITLALHFNWFTTRIEVGSTSMLPDFPRLPPHVHEAPQILERVGPDSTTKADFGGTSQG